MQHLDCGLWALNHTLVHLPQQKLDAGRIVKQIDPHRSRCRGKPRIPLNGRGSNHSTTEGLKNRWRDDGVFQMDGEIKSIQLNRRAFVVPCVCPRRISDNGLVRFIALTLSEYDTEGLSNSSRTGLALLSASICDPKTSRWVRSSLRNGISSFPDNE